MEISFHCRYACVPGKGPLKDNLDPLLQVSVGRLGVITELDFEIVPQQMLARTAVSLSIDEAVDGIAAVSSAYAAALSANASASQIQEVLAPLDMTQACARTYRV